MSLLIAIAATIAAAVLTSGLVLASAATAHEDDARLAQDDWSEI